MNKKKIIILSKVDKKKSITLHEKYEKNPFVERAIEEVRGHIVRKYKTASKTGEKAILQAIDQTTGEILGHTSFIRQIEIDEDKFTKLYLSQFSAFFDLGKQAIRVFGYIMTKLIPNQDMFQFFMKEALEYTTYKNPRQIYQGLTNLLNCEIIARTDHDIIYFINPLVIFNGNRVTYANSYVKKKKEKDPMQLNVFEAVKNFESEKK